jgi:DNA-binding MarR family transcriptional regulator
MTLDCRTTQDRPQRTVRAAKELLTSMVDLIRTTRSVAHRQTDALGITGTPFGILRKLATGDARPSDLACSLQIAPSVVSRALVPLEKSGLVERRQDPDDARAWRLGLTVAGRNRLDERQDYINDRFAELLSGWDPADLEQLALMMRTLDASLVDGVDRLVRHVDGVDRLVRHVDGVDRLGRHGDGVGQLVPHSPLLPHQPRT